MNNYAGEKYYGMLRICRLMPRAAAIIAAALSPTFAQDISSSADTSSVARTVNADPPEAMELGGLVTFDLAAPASDMPDIGASIGEVNLAAKVNIAESVTASIVLLAEGNLDQISIDEALVAWAPEEKQFAFLFGQQGYNHGLLSTHLISDPLILDAAETVAPGLCANMSFGVISPGVAVAYLHRSPETETALSMNWVDSSIISEEHVITPGMDVFAGIINMDIIIREESMVRASARYYGDILDMAIGAGLVCGPVSIDIETFFEAMDDNDAAASGAYAGAAWAISDHLEVAARYDALSADMFSTPDHRVGAGATVNFVHGIFAAVEYGHTILGGGNGQGDVALQIGLEQTIKLPGFRRRTLTRN